MWSNSVPMAVLCCFLPNLGGSKHNKGLGVAIDASDQAYITGVTHSSNFPTVNAYQASNAGIRDAFVAKLPADGSALLFSTYFGGQKADQAWAIALDGAGDIYITGWTRSSNNFPITLGAAQLAYGGGDRDAFVAKLSGDGQSLHYSTFLGGGQRDRASDIVVDPNGAATITGWTKSQLDLPTTSDAFQSNYGGGGTDTFITRLSVNGSTIDYSTYLGGSGDDKARAIAQNKIGQVVVTGWTDSADFATANPTQPLLAGARDAFITRFTSDTTRLQDSTYFGGTEDDRGHGLALDPAGNAYVTGMTQSQDLPIVNALQPSFGGGSQDAFVAKFGDNVSPDIVSTPITLGKVGLLYTYDVDATDANGDVLTYSLDTTPTGMVIDPNTGFISFTPITAGNFTVDITVSDGRGGLDTQSYTLTVILNQVPTITSTPVTTGTEGEPYTYDVDATDPDNDTLTFSLTVFPTGMVIDANTGVITWTSASPGQVSVTATVDDNRGGTDSQSYTVNVAPADSTPPVITITSPANNSVTNQTTQTIVGTLSEPATLTINGQAVAVAANNSFSHNITLAGGTNLITLIATDAAGNISTQVLTLILNQAPVTTATVDTAYSYAVTAIDADGDTLSFSLTAAPLGMAINASTGLITWTPVNAGAVQVMLVVSDGQGAQATQNFTVTVNFAPGLQPPGLAPIGDQTVQLGTTLTLQFSATDPDGGEPIFTIEPMPLLRGMTLNAVTGVFTFTPDETQVGTHTITVIASDGRFEDSETININVPPPSGVTSLRGQVLTTNGAPLAGVRLEIAGVETATDTSGNYLLDNLPVSGDVRLLVDGSTVDPSLGTFATVPEMINLIAGAANLLEPAIFLLPLDVASADPVSATAESIVTSSRIIEGLTIHEPITLTIPAGAAIDDATGLPFKGIMHISRVTDPSQGPRPLPDDIDLSVYMALQPFGVTYPQPVPISFPNIEGFPPGSIMDFFALNHDTGAFEKIGEGLVSADGKTIDSIGGVVKANSWHGIVPQAPVTEEAKEPDQDKQKDPCEDMGCTFSVESGNLGESHILPAYYSLGQARTVRLRYNSTNANPRPIITTKTGIGNLAPPPVSMSMELAVGGIDQGFKLFSEAAIERSNVRGQFLPARPSVQFNAAPIATGVYDYALKVDCHFPISRRSETLRSQTIVQNDSRSPFGAGWTLDGLQAIHINANGLAFITEGNDIGVVFTPINNTNFDSPPADFSTLTRNADNSFTRRMKDGTLYQFDINGRQTSRADRNGNTTIYTYDSEGKLALITDPVGQTYSFTYFAGRIQSIVDPVGRTTRFEHDSEGNLTKIIEPTGDERSFEYQALTHLMTAQTDQRDNRSEYSYNFAGRIIGSLLPDGSTPTLEPSVTQGLIDPATGQGTEDNLAPSPILFRDVQNRRTDHNGNLTQTKTDAVSAPVETLDAVGRTMLTERDRDSNPIKTTQPNGSVITRTFDGRGNALTVREDFNGALYTYIYDAFSLVTSFTKPQQSHYHHQSGC